MKNKKILLKILIIITVLIAIVLILEKVYADKIPASGTLRDEANEKAMIKNCVWKLCKEDSNGTITGTRMASKMNKYLSSDKVTVKENQTEKTLYITYSKSGRTYTLKTDTLELIGEDVGGTMVETYLPTGFKQVIGTTLANGLTIEDSKGNQYVWVEVPKTSTVYPTAGLKITNFTTDEYNKIENDLHTYTNDYRNGTKYKDEYHSDEATGLTSEQYTGLKHKMLKSVYQNGGFYVGKYETGIEDAPKTSGSSSTAPTETPVIKQNAYPYTWVTCSQAQTLASSMESGNYTSSLMFGVQWDLVLKYLETKGTRKANLKKDSTTWGNYYDNLWNITNTNSKYAIMDNKTYKLGNWTSGAYGAKGSNKEILLSTGASDEFSKQGIYDLAGNVWEFTLEYTSEFYRPVASRGGNFSYYGFYTAAYRANYDTLSVDNRDGFRVSLF